MAFIQRFEWMTGVLVDPQACWRVAYENVEDARREGLDYIELRFSPWLWPSRNGLKPRRLVEAVVDGARRAAADFAQPVGLIGISAAPTGRRSAARSWKRC
jgi:adenosine deaminase